MLVSYYVCVHNQKFPDWVWYSPFKFVQRAQNFQALLELNFWNHA